MKVITTDNWKATMTVPRTIVVDRFRSLSDRKLSVFPAAYLMRFVSKAFGGE